MASLLIKTCLQRSLSKYFINDALGTDRNFKLKAAIFDLASLQCNCYHNTPVLLKKRKSAELKKKEMEKKEADYLRLKKNKANVISVWKNMSVKELAASTGRPIDDILQALFYVDKNNAYEPDSIFVDFPIINATVNKLGLKCKMINPQTESKIVDEELNDAVPQPPPDPSVLVPRRPIVTIMGHVDHGKTTLLDSLRHSSVVDTEFGGITQHIGAFNVTVSNGEKITFLDTPGHAAFTSMRARGANVTDIVILVVAADDGVMEQTVQSIKMARDAFVPIIVAINKIDKPTADIQRTYHMLAEQGIYVEALGGEVQSINISALKGTNLDQLMEAILTQAEMMSLKGDPTGLVEGTVIEAKTEVGKGKVATALIKRGTLKKGAVLVAGLAWGKARAMFDHAGTNLNQAGLSDAVQIIGWRELPIAGDEILEVENEKIAHRALKYRNAKIGEKKSMEQKIVADEKHREHLVEYEKIVKKRRLTGMRHIKPEGPRQKLYQEDDFPQVNVIVKGDVVGSLEAILNVLETYDDEKRCRLSLVNYGVGPVTATDIELAKVFDAVIYCFNTTVPHTLVHEIQTQEISIRHHNVIYKLVDDLKDEINRKLPMVKEEEEIGQAVVLKQFDINVKTKKVRVAGCRCEEGLLKKSEYFKVIRENEVIHIGKAISLKHVKEEVETIKTNTECGLMLENFNEEFVPGDKIICYKLVDKIQETNWDPGF